MSLEEDLEKKRHMLYYNQLLQNDRKTKLHNEKRKSVKKQSFGQQKIDIKDFIYVLEGYESVFYIFYLVAIPYFAGITFIYLFIAGANYKNFMLLDLNSFIIVWLIGYEIVAAFLLFWIFILFLQYEKEDNDRYGFG